MVTGAVGGMRIGRVNRSTRRKPAPVPLCPPQIPHYPTWVRTRAAEVGSRWLSARPCSRLTQALTRLICIFRYSVRFTLRVQTADSNAVLVLQSEYCDSVLYRQWQYLPRHFKFTTDIWEELLQFILSSSMEWLQTGVFWAQVVSK
jgi:hypothetical protein